MYERRAPVLDAAVGHEHRRAAGHHRLKHVRDRAGSCHGSREVAVVDQTEHTGRRLVHAHGEFLFELVEVLVAVI